MSAYDDLCELLRQDAILAPEYKQRIRGHASLIAQEAYRRGQDEGPQVQPHAEPRRAVTRYTLTDTIESVLETLCETQGRDSLVELAYTDADDKFTVRTIRPIRLFENALSYRRAGRALLAIDTTNDEPRHFRLDRIEWIEVSS